MSEAVTVNDTKTSSNENVKRPTRYRHPHGFLFTLLKSAGLGALAGLGIVCLNEVFSKHKKIVVNKFHGRLPIKNLEGLGEEPEVCEYFHLMNVKQFRSINPIAYDTALEKCSDLCFLGESIANGILDEFIPKIKAHQLDPFTDLHYDTDALNLWYSIHDQLQILYNSVRDTEFQKVHERDLQEEKYKHDFSQWENDCLNWKTRQLERERASMKHENENLFDFSVNSVAVIAPAVAAELDPELIKPVEPAREKFRSDFAEEYATAIDHRTRQIFVFIRDSLDKFRKKYGQEEDEEKV
jgi:hypothetical protein